MTDYITDNWALTEALQRLSQERSIEYAAFSDNWVVRLRQGKTERFAIGTALECNNQASAAIAADKVAAYQLLTDAGLASVAHYLVKSAPDIGLNAAVLQELFDAHQSLVLKPLRGGRGSHVGKFENVETARAFATANPEEAWTASPYIDIQRELRLVVFDGAIRLAYEKTEPKVINNLKMYNLNLGAKPKDVGLDEIDSSLKDLAAQALRALGLRLGAVDVVIGPDGRPQVLEINASFSLEHYAATSLRRREQVVKAYMYIMGVLFN